MGRSKLAIPSNLTQLAGMAGIAVVVLTTLGIRGVVPHWTLPVLGAFLGFAAIRDSKGFLISGMALLAAKWGLGHLPVFGHLAQDLANNLVALVAPAMLVVAIRSLYYDLKG